MKHHTVNFILGLAVLLLSIQCNCDTSHDDDTPPPATAPQEASPEIINFFDTSIDIAAYAGKEPIKNISELQAGNSQGKIIPWFGFCEPSNVKNKGLDHTESNGCGLFSNYYNQKNQATFGHPVIPWTQEMMDFYAINRGQTADTYNPTNPPVASDGKKATSIHCVEHFFQLFKCLQSPKGNSPFLSTNYSRGPIKILLGTAHIDSTEVMDAVNHLLANNADTSKAFAAQYVDNTFDANKFAIRDKAMFYALLQKFPNDKNHPYTKKLLATGNAVLVEGNQWGDNRFGAVVKTASPLTYTNTAENKLGKMLMLIRYIRYKGMSHTD